MKITLPPLYLSAFTLCMFLIACESPTQNQNVEQGQAHYVTQKLYKAKKEADTKTRKAAIVQEWETLKSLSSETIQNNTRFIAELQLDLRKSATLTRRNKDLQTRLESYQPSQSDWEVFRRAFNNDMQELRNTLKALARDNK